jgi:hypothetical protein
MIIIPAANCSSPKTSTKNVQFTKSFLGGQQLHQCEGDVFEYTLTDVVGGAYQIVLRLCTVHLKQQALLLTITSPSSATVDVTTMVIPYTIGEWVYTDPVTVDLADGVNVLSFTRETPNFGLTIKDITLTKCD